MSQKIKKYYKKQTEEEVIIIYTKPQLGFHHQVVQYSKALGPPSLSASVEQQGRRYQQRFDRVFQKGKNITRKRRGKINSKTQKKKTEMTVQRAIHHYKMLTMSKNMPYDEFKAFSNLYQSTIP